MFRNTWNELVCKAKLWLYKIGWKKDTKIIVRKNIVNYTQRGFLHEHFTEQPKPTSYNLMEPEAIYLWDQ